VADADERYCLVEGLDALDQQSGNLLPPWAPGQREEWADVERATGDDIWCMAEGDIFADLSAAEMEAIAAAAPMKTYSAGDLLYSPHQPIETLFILKKGRVRIFRSHPTAAPSPPLSSHRARSSATWCCSASRCTTTSPKHSTTSWSA
jgi:CRP/FNR family cyclic AMP-dependent transcriptional regulator